LVVVQQGEILTWCGQAEEGIGWIRKAMRLNPFTTPSVSGATWAAHCSWRAAMARRWTR
jgi:hypothetical protein